jgi:hypothetical protein
VEFRHLRRHRIGRAEAEQVLNNNPLDLECPTEGGAERYKSRGITDSEVAL